MKYLVVAAFVGIVVSLGSALFFMMRNGNNERHEFLFQVGFNGFELGAEGPFSKNSKASYLANFRYSTLELMDDIIDVGTTGVPKYKDLSFKLNFPMKKGRISVIALAGDSDIAMLDSKDGNEQDLYTDEGQEIAAKHYYRPRAEKIAKKYEKQFPKVALINIDQAFGGWARATKIHFADGGSFDQIYQPGAK